MKTRSVLAMLVYLICSVAVTGQPGRQDPPPPPAPKELVAPDIPEVVKGGTKIVLIRDGFNGTEGPIAMPDGSLLFTEQNANKLIRIDRNDQISTYLENTNRTRGLAYDINSRLIGAQSGDPLIGVLAPTRSVLVDSFEGQLLVAPNDLVADRKGGIYFSDSVTSQRAGRKPPPGRKAWILYLRADGKLLKVTEDIPRPNGVQLSPDEKTLYATNDDTIMAFDVQPDGSTRNIRKFVESGGDGLAVDDTGRLYSAVAGVRGVRVFSPQGQDLGTIPTGAGPQNLAFAGPDKKTLYMVGGGAVYKVQMIAQGIKSRAK